MAASSEWLRGIPLACSVVGPGPGPFGEEALPLVVSRERPSPRFRKALLGWAWL